MITQLRLPSISADPIPVGRVHVLSGPPGSGKSSFLLLLRGLAVACSGRAHHLPFEGGLRLRAEGSEYDYDVRYGLWPGAGNEYRFKFNDQWYDGDVKYVLRESVSKDGVLAGQYDGKMVQWRESFRMAVGPNACQLFKFEMRDARALRDWSVRTFFYSAAAGWSGPVRDASCEVSGSSGQRSLGELEYAGGLLDRGFTVVMDDAGVYLSSRRAAPAILALAERAARGSGQLFLASPHDLDLPDVTTLAMSDGKAEGNDSTDLRPWPGEPPRSRDPERAAEVRSGPSEYVAPRGD